MPDTPHVPDAGTAHPETADPKASTASVDAARRPISRREFARRAAIASAVASVAPAAAVTAELASTHPSAAPIQEPKSAVPAPAPPAAVAPQNVLPTSPKLSPESQAEADARFQTILVLYGNRFSNEQKNDIHRLCAVAQPALDRVRAYKVENGDGTALYLKPQYEREKKPKPQAAPKSEAAVKSAPAKPAATPAKPAAAPAAKTP